MRSMGLLQNVATRIRGMVEDQNRNFAIRFVDEHLKEELEHAKQDWVFAQNYFQNVTDPALVDHAVYLLEAAEAKYAYLLKQARVNIMRG